MIIIFIFAFCSVSFAQDEKPKIGGIGNGSGTGKGNGNGRSTPEIEDTQPREKPVITANTNRGVMILSKPRAIYTDRARQNQLQGQVILRVTFKSDGRIGKVKVVSGLADGLTQNAIEAAKKIKFEPQIKNGKPITTKKSVMYSFTLY